MFLVLILDTHEIKSFQLAIYLKVDLKKTAKCTFNNLPKVH